MVRGLARGALVAVALSLSRAASACPACAGTRPLSTGYLIATGLMLLLPVALVGALVLWLRRASARSLALAPAPPTRE